jgi:Ca2+-transporting ATPase
MGRSGAEAAREASDIVLTNDDLATVVAAVREGRRIFDNIRKFVAFLLSANLGEVALFTVAILAGFGAPMTVVQILVINLLTDGLPAIALARDPLTVEGDRSRGRHGHLLPAHLWAALGAVGLLVGAAAFTAFAAGRAMGGDIEQTMAFATIGLSELVLVFSCRSVRKAAWGVPRNGYLVASVLGSLAVLIGAVYLPLNSALGTVALGPAAAGIVVGLALVPAVAVELAKTVARHRGG